MSVDFGYATRPVRGPAFSGRLPLRVLAVSAALTVAAVAAAVVSLALGEYPLPVDRAFLALLGGGDPFERSIVQEWRAPVALAALVFGALLGIGGAVFQSLTRNPLGSPDVIGFDAGSYTAVVVSVLLLGGGGYLQTAAAALAGGLSAAVVVLALASRRGVQGFRLIIVGVAVAALLGSANAFLVSRAGLTDAMTIGFWAAGSLARVTWATLLPATALAVLVVAAAAALASAMRRLESGDDLASALGTRPGSTRLLLVVTGVASTAIVTAAAGPMGFIALAAPQLARRLTRAPGTDLLGAAAMGAALLAAAHLLSLVVGAMLRPVPTGLVTVCLGGLYLIHLLVREARQDGGAR